MYQGFMHLDTETRAAELHWSFLFLVNLAPLTLQRLTASLHKADQLGAILGAQSLKFEFVLNFGRALRHYA